MIEQFTSVPRRCSESAICVLTLFLLMPPSLSFAEPAASADPASKQDMERIIEQYIRTHPEVIEQSLQTLEARRLEDERQRSKIALATRQN
ncbi:MAG: hypothetical protein Q8S75_02215, partial [Nitrospirota bacterium]|nr:hypothetical protein [Nitrospirota bacterium]